MPKKRNLNNRKKEMVPEEEEALRIITSVISESRTIIALIGILFGFLLNVSVSMNLLDNTERLLLVTSLVFSILTVGIFSLPVIYHHIEFPYRDPIKFSLRYHWFMSAGFIPFILTFFFSAMFALHRLIGEGAFALNGLLFLMIAIVYALRRKSVKIISG